MHLKIALAAAAAALAAAAGTAGAAGGGILYTFVGKLTATPSGGHVSLTIDGGNRPALRALLGQPVAQTFSYGSDTEFLHWNDGVPSVVQAGDLDSGDVVRVNVRAPRGSSLATIESTSAKLIGDHGPNPTKPDKPLFLFRGQVVSTGTSSITIEARGGDRRALRLLLGEPRTQTFAVGSSTIYLTWKGIVPTVTSLADVKPGDRVQIRVRAAAGSTLAEVEATTATKVTEHEPGS